MKDYWQNEAVRATAETIIFAHRAAAPVESLDQRALGVLAEKGFISLRQYRESDTGAEYQIARAEDLSGLRDVIVYPRIEILEVSDNGDSTWLEEQEDGRFDLRDSRIAGAFRIRLRKDGQIPGNRKLPSEYEGELRNLLARHWKTKDPERVRGHYCDGSDAMRVECPRCGGTGRHSYCSLFRDVCFQCEGRRTVLVRWKSYAETNARRRKSLLNRIEKAIALASEERKGFLGEVDRIITFEAEVIEIKEIEPIEGRPPVKLVRVSSIPTGHRAGFFARADAAIDVGKVYRLKGWVKSQARFGSSLSVTLAVVSRWTVEDWEFLGTDEERARLHAKRDTADRKKNQRYLGAVGDEISGAFEVRTVKEVTSRFGISNLVVIENAEGNRAKFFTTRPVRVGQPVVVAGIVKECEEWNGWKSTLLRKVKF